MWLEKMRWRLRRSRWAKAASKREGRYCYLEGKANQCALQTVLVLKYVREKLPFPALGFGISNVVANALIMLSSVVLWVSQNLEDEYSYNLTL